MIGSGRFASRALRGRVRRARPAASAEPARSRNASSPRRCERLHQAFGSRETGAATRRSDTTRGVGESPSRQARASARLGRRTVGPPTAAPPRRTPRPAGERAPPAGSTPRRRTRSVVAVRAPSCAATLEAGSGEGVVAAREGVSAVVVFGDGRTAPPGATVVSTLPELGSAGAGLGGPGDGGGTGDGAGAGEGATTGAGAGTG
jgi:hypothetical protein